MMLHPINSISIRWRKLTRNISIRILKTVLSASILPSLKLLKTIKIIRGILFAPLVPVPGIMIQLSISKILSMSLMLLIVYWVIFLSIMIGNTRPVSTVALLITAVFTPVYLITTSRKLLMMPTSNAWLPRCVSWLPVVTMIKFWKVSSIFQIMAKLLLVLKMPTFSSRN